MTSTPLAQVEREEMKERLLTREVEYPDKFSQNAALLCEGLLAKEVGKRMGFKNGSCDEIRAHPFFSDINWRKLNAGDISCRSFAERTYAEFPLMLKSGFDVPVQEFCHPRLCPTPGWCTPKAWTMWAPSPR